MSLEKKIFIVEVSSFTGKDTSREQFSPHFQAVDKLYSVVLVTAEGAEIIDDAYRSRDEARIAWPEAV